MRVLYNAKIDTLDPNLPSATAIGIVNGVVKIVGTDDQVLGEAGPRDEKLDLRGKKVWPGLTDAHIHLEQYALSLGIIDCETATRQECLERVARRAQSVPGGAWVRGHGWNQNVWGGVFGSAEELDRVSGDHPVYLTAKSLHAAWANSRALQIAGVDRFTTDPEGGKIDRDANGAPTGILFESAMGLINRVLPEPSVQEVCRAISDAQAALWKVGITGLHDYDQSRCFSALQILHEENRLQLRVIKGIPLADLPNAVSLGLRSGFGDDFLRIGNLKLFADGALGPHTAAMLEPYENEPENTGMLFLDSEQVFEYGQEAARSGIGLSIHAIGDRANHEVLNGYAHLRQYETQNHLPHLRHRIEHVQILHPEDLARLAALDVIASVQPIHATSDMYMADSFWGSRSAGAYAYRSLLDQGTHLAFGSDAPVENPNPFSGMHAAVTRTRWSGEPAPEGWYPQQRLTLEQALHAYTTGPAYAAGLETRLGQLAPGSLADLIVLPVDPYQVSPSDLHRIVPEATMVSGQWVWQVE
jgi:predicted amidohydrolase YtcJ